MAATVAAMTARLATSPTDSDAAVRLADTWLRQARVLNRSSLHVRAEDVLNRVIDAAPSDYLARRMRATVYLAQHRFQDAVLEAGRCRALRDQDPVVDGILGDALLELGDLPAAIEAFDRMLAQRPDAASYARASYARELQGDLRGALALMKMADEATSAHDVESQAWHAAQIGNLHVSANFYMRSVITSVKYNDLASGIGKTFFFGFAIGLIGCFNGLRTTGGADGVGRATTVTVVTGAITVLIMDFFLTKLFLLVF